MGSTTCKYVLATPRGNVLAQAYERHNTRQAEKILQFLTMLESKHGLTAGRDRVFFTGSGAGIIAPLVGGKVVQEVVAVAAAVDKLHPSVRFVSEIGGEDMKTIFFQGEGASAQQAGLHAERLLRRHRHVHREDRAQAARSRRRRLAQMGYSGYPLHKISSKCGIFAEADANTLVKAGVPVEEIIASLFEAVVYQNLATLDARQHTVARGAAARRTESVLQRPAGSVATSPREGLEGAQSYDLGRSRRSSLIRVPTMRFITPPRLHRDWIARERRGRALHRTRTAEVVDRTRPVRREEEDWARRSVQRRRGPFHF